MFNDCAVAARAMQREGRARRVVIVDCDVHQGNGTAAILPAIAASTLLDARRKNFPLHKEQSDLDVELPDAADDRCTSTCWPAGSTGCSPRPAPTWRSISPEPIPSRATASAGSP